MNKVELTGRLTRDPDVKKTGSQEDPLTVARFSLAVDRRGKREEGRQNADFIGCVAFGKLGLFAENWLKKGTKVELVGHIQSGSYTDNEGHTRYSTEVVAEELSFAEAKRETKQETDENGFATAYAEDDIPEEWR